MRQIILLLLAVGVFSQTANERTVWNYLKGQGLTDAGAAGLMGNLKAESRIESVIYEDAFKGQIGLSDWDYVRKTNDGSYTNFVYDQVGFGLAQWTYYTRKQALLNMCWGDVGNLNCQLNYLMTEFRSTYINILNVLKSSWSVRECSDLVMLDFETPVDRSQAKKDLRFSYSDGYYQMFTGSGGGSSERTYTVQSGDSLYVIAQWFGTTVDAICSRNGISNPDYIYVGQLLYIP